MTTTEPRSQRLRTRDLDDLLALDLPPRDYLISPWLKQFESAMIWAPPGVGKTMFCLSLALAIAGGGEFLGWKAPVPRKVLFFDGEMAIHDLQERLKMLSGTIEGLDMEAAGRNLKVCSRQDQDPEVHFPDFGMDRSQKGVLDYVRTRGYDLVILDNLSTLASVEDENSAAAIRPIIKFLMQLKQSNIACIVVHHSNKGGKDYRGSTNLATTFEVILGLHRADSVLDTDRGTKFTTEWAKFRGLRDDTIGPRKVCLETTDGVSRWVVESDTSEVLAAISEMLRSGDYSTQDAVIKALPERFWPTPDTPPSVGWGNKQFRLLKAQGIMSKHEIRACLDAGREGGSVGDDWDDEEEDF